MPFVFNLKVVFRFSVTAVSMPILSIINLLLAVAIIRLAVSILALALTDDVLGID
jgi:hypothetical protein